MFCVGLKSARVFKSVTEPQLLHSQLLYEFIYEHLSDTVNIVACVHINKLY